MDKNEAVKVLEKLFEIREEECLDSAPYWTSEEAQSLALAISVLKRIDKEETEAVNARIHEMIIEALSLCQHKTFHFEGRNLAYLVCSCGKRWEREVNYIKNTRYTYFKAVDKNL